MACAGSAAARSASSSHHAWRLARMRVLGGRGTPPLERLRVEVDDGERVVAEVLAGDFAHLVGGDFAQLGELQVDGVVRDAGNLQYSDLARLEHHRIALVDVRRDRLRARPLELL